MYSICNVEFLFEGIKYVSRLNVMSVCICIGDLADLQDIC